MLPRLLNRRRVFVLVCGARGWGLKTSRLKALMAGGIRLQSCACWRAWSVWETLGDVRHAPHSKGVCYLRHFELRGKWGWSFFPLFLHSCKGGIKYFVCTPCDILFAGANGVYDVIFYIIYIGIQSLIVLSWATLNECICRIKVPQAARVTSSTQDDRLRCFLLLFLLLFDLAFLRNYHLLMFF